MAPRDWVPPKMTSSILPLPRSCLELVSPRTQRMESEMFDLPEPFGPTTPVMPSPISIFVLSGKDLKPWISSSFRRIPWVPFKILKMVVGAGHARPSTSPYVPVNGSRFLCRGPGMPGPYRASLIAIFPALPLLRAVRRLFCCGHGPRPAAHRCARRRP